MVAEIEQSSLQYEEANYSTLRADYTQANQVKATSPYSCPVTNGSTHLVYFSPSNLIINRMTDMLDLDIIQIDRMPSQANGQ